MNELKKMKYLLLLPITGSVVIMSYLNIRYFMIEANKNSHLKRKHWFLVGFIIGIIFWFVAVALEFIIIIINRFIILNDTLHIILTVVAFIVAGYCSNVPCLFYVNYLLKESNEENNIIGDQNNTNNEG